MEIGEIKEIFKKKFELPSGEFSHEIDLQDALGFSVYKEQKDLGRSNFKSIFKVYIKNEEFKKEGNIKPVTVTASYGKEAEDGIISDTSDISVFKREVNWPVELISKNDFFYNIITADFLYKNKSITGNEILNKINEWHLKPTKPITGFVPRFKLRYYTIIVPKIWEVLFDITSSIESFLSGNEKKNIHDDKERKTKEITKDYKEPINIFGYIIELRTAFIYSLIHLIIYFIFYYFNFKPLYLLTIFKNSFLITMYVIFTLTTTLKGPTILLRWIHGQYYRIIFKSIKI